MFFKRHCWLFIVHCILCTKILAMSSWVEKEHLCNKEDISDFYVSCLSCGSPCYKTGATFFWILNSELFGIYCLNVNIMSFTNHNRLNHTSGLWTEQRTMIPPSSQSGSESSPALSKDQSLWLCSFWPILFLGWAGHGCPEVPLWMKSLASAFRDG